MLRFLASDMKFDDGAGKEERKGRRKHRHKNDKETLYIEGIPYRRIAILPGSLALQLNSAQFFSAQVR